MATTTTLETVKFDQKKIGPVQQKELQTAYQETLKYLKEKSVNVSTKFVAPSIAATMTSKKKDALFQLVVDGKKASVVVNIGGSITPLGAGTATYSKAEIKKLIDFYKGLSLSKALSDPKIYAEVKQDAKEEFSTENYAFLDAVKTRASAKLIYDTFIAKNSKMEINITSGEYNRVTAQMATGKVDFGPTVKIIMDLVDRDHFPRFKNKKIQMLKELDKKAV
jgi:hypothetical protein